MPSPFPGMDPYLESPKFWSGFYTRFIVEWAKTLNALVPRRRYAVEIEDRIRLVREEDNSREFARPDAVIMRMGPTPLRLAEDMSSAVAELPRPPVILPLEPVDYETTRFVQIIQSPEDTLVAVLELLSPWNKETPGHAEYLAQRAHWIRQGVHLIELDLLTAGRRLPLGGPLPDADYYAMVSRGDRRPDCEVYAWSVRERLPTIRVPLSAPDPDVLLDLQPIVDEVYDSGPYAWRVDYRSDPKARLREADRLWAKRQGCPA